MPIPEKYTAPFNCDSYYHIICKALPNQLLFTTDDHKAFFLQRYQQFLGAYLSTYAYCILANHVHLLVRVNKASVMKEAIEKIPDNERTLAQKKILAAEDFESVVSYFLERQFNSFFVSYTRSFNIQQKRKGHLFDSPFKRILVSSNQHITHLILYIHANAQKHKLVNNFKEYKWSSYLSMMSNKPTHLMRAEVIAWFGSKAAFEKFHESQSNHYYDNSLDIFEE